MRFAKINMIDSVSGKIVSDTIVLPYSIALIELDTLTGCRVAGERVWYDLAQVSEDQFNLSLFKKYTEMKQGKITNDQYQEAVFKSKREHPVNLRTQS